MANKFGLGKGLGALIPERLPVRGTPDDRFEVANGFASDVRSDNQGTETANRADNAHDPDNSHVAARTPSADERTEGEEIFIIPLASIRPNPDQPRKDFSEESIDELASSIKRHGLIQPILVELYHVSGDTASAVDTDGNAERKLAGDTAGYAAGDAAGEVCYRIIAGERRYRAALRAGLENIPAIVRRFTAEKRLEISLIENIQREDLNAVEEAEAYHRLMQISGSTQDEVAEMVGKSRSAIANAVRLLRLSPRMLESLRSGGVSAGHARALLSLPDAPVRDKLFERILGESLSVRQTEDAAQTIIAAASEGGRAAKAAKAAKKTAAASAAAGSRDPDLVAVEQRLIQSLGTKVSIKGTAKKGIVEVEYYSLEDLDRILDVLGK